MSPNRSSRGRLGRRLVALTAAVALGVAGCGVSQDGSDYAIALEAGRFDGPSGAAYLGEVAEATGDLTTQKMSMEMVIEGVPMMGDLALTSEGQFDNENERGRLSMDMSAMFDSMGAGSGLPAGSGVIEMVIDGDVAYMKSPLLSELGGSDKPWLRVDSLDLAEGGAMTGGAQSNPQAFLEFLRSAGSVDELGTETIRGVETTHLGAELALEDFVAQAPEAERAELEETLESLGTEGLAFPAIPAEVWVDGEGYVRKFEMTFDFADLGESTDEAGSMGMDEMSMTIAVEFYDFDQPVDITIPDPSEVGELDPSILGGN